MIEGSFIQLYLDNASEAIEFYEKEFNAKIHDGGDYDEDHIYHVEIDVLGHTFGISDRCFNGKDIPTDKTCGLLDFCVRFEKGYIETGRKMYDAFKENAISIGEFETNGGDNVHWDEWHFGVMDKYGVKWLLYN